MNRIILLALLLIVMSLAACTKVTVKRVETGSEPGLRYYLPQPLIIVTPQEDGTIEVRVESIADRNEAYYVTATSIFASYKLALKHNQGLLTEASLSSDSSAVAAESVKAAGEVQKSKIEAETAARLKALEKQETAAKERRDEINKRLEAAHDDMIKKRDAAIEERQAEIKKLQNDYDAALLEQVQATAALSVATTPEAKAAAEVAKVKIDAKVVEMKRQLYIRKIPSSFSIVKESKFKENSRPGPVILQIKEDAKSGVLQLVPVNFDNEAQKIFASYERPPVAVEKQSKNIEFEKSSITFKFDNKPVKIEIATKNDLKMLKAWEIKGPQGLMDPKYLPNVTPKNSKTFELEFKLSPPPDNYNIQFFGDDNTTLSIKGEMIVEVTR